jgi:DNA-binding MarR family transcriptional regulator
MKLFSGLRKLRKLERIQLPFLKSVFDFDILVEVGYAEEMGQPLSLKRFYLLNICSRSTSRRKLARLVDQGIIIRRKNASDNRASLLLVSPSAVKMLGKYGGMLMSISASHFK